MIFGILIMMAFYGTIAVACYVTKSAWPLVALILAPDIEVNCKHCRRWK